MFTRLFAFAVLATAVFAHADGTAREVLEEINFARTQPAQYAGILEDCAEKYRGSEGLSAVREAVKFLRKAKPLPPLAWSPGIGQAALSHALDLGPRGGRGHKGARGDTPWKRMARYGKWEGHAGENIAYGRTDPRGIVMSLIIDDGVPSRLHRANLFSRNFRVTGIAVAPHARQGTMCVMDFATGYIEPGAARVATRTDAGYRSRYSGMSFF